ncbi:uncharacterized protein CTHT_0032050 [Thermochaetoides thermophila DSM 1495]|uniref:Uncharacterized protein n=1 Tax=Chaetomium thermophilum (strain DSM 1495 / CBS 144.50 / IMI 039719) TaxID=759272 RepID=G0S4X9_CHATD|nr:hypothetical protein CTHT_0032050 [Thermochaetoides thermophila DSM 1495]EGS21350.1 hypothetical protein CTHT_0032050 [Thermochaetoides thermophila DSM 1495]
MASKHGEIASIHHYYDAIFAEVVKIEKATDNLHHPSHGLIGAATEKIIKLMKNIMEIYSFTISILKNRFDIDSREQCMKDREKLSVNVDEKEINITKLQNRLKKKLNRIVELSKQLEQPKLGKLELEKSLQEKMTPSRNGL